MTKSLFEVIPELSTWIPVETLLSCCQVCKDWNQRLRRSTIVQKRLLIWKWPIVGYLLSIPPDSWAPWDVIHGLRWGALHGVCIVTAEPRNMFGDTSPMPTGEYGYTATRARADIVQQLNARGYRLDKNRSTQLRLVFRVNTERHLYVYEQVRCSMTQTAPSALQIYKDMGFCLWNRTSKSTDWYITHGWSYFDNGRAQMSDHGVRRAFQDHGYRMKLETRDCVLYQKHEE